MQLSRPDAELFFKLHHALMWFVNERLQIVPGIKTPDEFAALPAEARLSVRNAFLKKPDLIEQFVATNPFNFNAAELDTIRSWRDLVAGKFFMLRYLKKHAIFLQAEEIPVAYGVLALAVPFEVLIGPNLPLWTETVLLPFQGQIVFDGLLNSYNISFGPGYRRSLNESYNAAKNRMGIVTSLPIGSQQTDSPRLTKTLNKAKASPRPKTDDARDVLAMGFDFPVLGRAAILHHDFPRRAAADPNFAAIATPVSEQYLRDEGLGPAFVNYMRTWKGFVEERA